MCKIKWFMIVRQIGNIIYNGDDVLVQGIYLSGMFGVYFFIGIMIKMQCGNIGIDNLVIFMRVD